ncbi:helix-turn-helix domain-containing protein [Pseudonocardia sp. KRD291]|uniref:winged helix-turn-helix transcriptional regulator n=1 Tax=Pseudonocardia sp. KRD291 TaxID=2792007 RepID=UPI001C4A39C0|nr:helix-turn-helix domain-containing protein [Pseudonocardia sp. KRD291]MBW0102552.1 helix-turn-helix transcriptional regulator [Pseudonocardia sp. KRD291]
MAKAIRGGETCAIARTTDVLRDPWTFLILREAFGGVTRFSDLRANLGVASDVLTQRLDSLVSAQVLRREQYREAGSRTRSSYHLTEAGAELKIAVAALQQWGDAHLPVECGPTVARRHRSTGVPLEVAFVDPDGRRVDLVDADFERTAAYPT